LRHSFYWQPRLKTSKNPVTRKPALDKRS